MRLTGVGPRVVVAGLALVVAGCSAASSTPSSSATPTTSVSIAEPTSTPRPLAMPRPTDLPTDGTCERGHICLGLLEPNKVYTTTAFKPQITFSVPEAGWQNISDEGGVFHLLPIADPGDAIAFFRDPRATDPLGVYADGVGATVDELATWLAANPLLDVTAAQPTTIGGLSGVTMDIKVAVGATAGPADCPVQACVGFFKGTDKHTWAWDWGSAGIEVQRVYLLTSADGVVAIFVDSLDGTTFESLTSKADAILATVKFG